MSEMSSSGVREHKGLTVALWSAAVCFCMLLPITIFLGILGGLLGEGDCLWVRTATMLLAVAFGLPGVVLGAVTLLKLRRAAPVAVAGTVAVAAIVIGAMSVGEGVYVTTSLVPSWQNTVDRMHG